MPHAKFAVYLVTTAMLKEGGSYFSGAKFQFDRFYWSKYVDQRVCYTARKGTIVTGKLSYIDSLLMSIFYATIKHHLSTHLYEGMLM